MKFLHINTEALISATEMELAGTGKGPVTSVEVFIVTDRSARIRLHWEYFPLNQMNSFAVGDTTTYDELRELIASELDSIETEIDIFNNK